MSLQDSINNSKFSFGVSLLIFPPTKSIQANGQFGHSWVISPFNLQEEMLMSSEIFQTRPTVWNTLTTTKTRTRILILQGRNSDSKILSNLPEDTDLAPACSLWWIGWLPAWPVENAGGVHFLVNLCEDGSEFKWTGQICPGQSCGPMIKTTHVSAPLMVGQPHEFSSSRDTSLPSLLSRWLAKRTQKPSYPGGEVWPPPPVWTCHFHQCPCSGCVNRSLGGPGLAEGWQRGSLQEGSESLFPLLEGCGSKSQLLLPVDCPPCLHLSLGLQCHTERVDLNPWP